jgi:hypothetical protein
LPGDSLSKATQRIVPKRQKGRKLKGWETIPTHPEHSMVYLITYDLNKIGQNYDGLYKAIKNLGSSWWHYLDSIWLVEISNSSADQISDILIKEIDKNDYILVVRVLEDYGGWLKKEAWDWIKDADFN